jgi:hypothetical protein
VLIRPDRDDAEYRELASRYTSSIALSAPASEAVLVAPRWLLTHAGHLPEQGKPLLIGGRAYEIARIVVHPDAKPRSPAELALIELREAVRDLKPTPVYRLHDEAGKAVVFVGHGDSGIIGEEARFRDGRARAAINTIDRLSPLTASLPIKDLDEAADLQGKLGPGEEGAAAYIQTDDGLFVAGLYYGDVTVWNLFSRLSGFAGWIDATLGTAH